MSEPALTVGQYIVMVEGTEAEIRHAETVVRMHQIQGFYTLDLHSQDSQEKDGQEKIETDNLAYSNSRPLVETIDNRH